MEQIDLQNDLPEVQIASAGSRIAAYLINMIAQLLAVSPIIWSLVKPLFPDPNVWMNKIDSASTEAEMEALFAEYMQSVDMSLFYTGLFIFIAYAIWQIMMMSKRGQSLGKQIMGIAVIKEDGSPAGFMGVVLLREGLFLFAIMILASLISIATGSQELVDLFNYVPWLVCLVMIFTNKDRRSLQDMIAKTVVVKLPSK